MREREREREGEGEGEGEGGGGGFERLKSWLVQVVGPVPV